MMITSRKPTRNAFALLVVAFVFLTTIGTGAYGMLSSSQVLNLDKRKSDAFFDGHPLMKIIWGAHQNFRAKAGLPSISYDNGLANEADMEAGFLLSYSNASCKKKFQHSDIIRVSKSAANQGVNSAELTGAKHSDFSSQEIEEVMKNWYKTKTLYQFPGGKEPFESCSNTSSAKDYGLFTQIMWSNSTRMGCGFTPFVECEKSVMVCLYEPKGNIKEHALMSDENYEELVASGENFETCKKSESMPKTNYCKVWNRIKRTTLLVFLIAVH